MPRNLLADYPPATARYDEMLEAPHTPRAHWRQMFEQLAATAPETLRERTQWLQRQVRENGVTYNVYADPEGADRPWELDMLPLIIPAAEWAGIEAAVSAARDAAQPRARRRLRRAAAAAGRAAAARAGLRPRRLPAALPRHPGARRRDAAPVRRRPRARARRPLVGGRRPHPGALGRGLCAGEPARHLAPVPGPVPRPAACSAWPASSPRCATASRTGRPPTARRRSPCCSRRGRSTKPISSTPTSRATSAFRWSKATTSRCATARCG